MHPDLISESPPTFQLNFEPAEKPGRDRDYYTEEKRNICVVCGSDKNCIRKNIVPHEYRWLGNSYIGAEECLLKGNVAVYYKG